MSKIFGFVKNLFNNNKKASSTIGFVATLAGAYVSYRYGVPAEDQAAFAGDVCNMITGALAK